MQKQLKQAKIIRTLLVFYCYKYYNTTTIPIIIYHILPIILLIYIVDSTNCWTVWTSLWFDEHNIRRHKFRTLELKLPNTNILKFLFLFTKTKYPSLTGTINEQSNIKNGAIIYRCTNFLVSVVGTSVDGQRRIGVSCFVN